MLPLDSTRRHYHSEMAEGRSSGRQRGEWLLSRMLGDGSDFDSRMVGPTLHSAPIGWRREEWCWLLHSRLLQHWGARLQSIRTAMQRERIAEIFSFRWLVTAQFGHAVLGAYPMDTLLAGRVGAGTHPPRHRENCLLLPDVVDKKSPAQLVGLSHCGRMLAHGAETMSNAAVSRGPWPAGVLYAGASCPSSAPESQPAVAPGGHCSDREQWGRGGARV